MAKSDAPRRRARRRSALIPFLTVVFVAVIAFNFERIRSAICVFLDCTVASWICNEAECIPDLSDRTDIVLAGSSSIAPLVGAVETAMKFKYGAPALRRYRVGSSGATHQFCKGGADIITSSRRQPESILRECEARYTGPVIEVKIGYDAIVLVTNRTDFHLTRRDLYLAFARDIPAPEAAEDGTCRFTPNTLRTWADISRTYGRPSGLPPLPDVEIKAFGPKKETSGTYWAFLEKGLLGGAESFECWRTANDPSEKRSPTSDDITIRGEPYFKAAQEFDDYALRDLDKPGNENALVIISSLTYFQFRDRYKTAYVDEVMPTYDTLLTEQYPLTRPLYLYINRRHAMALKKQGLDVGAFAIEFLSDDAMHSRLEPHRQDEARISQQIIRTINNDPAQGPALVPGPVGYLRAMGLVPAREDERQTAREDIRTLRPFRR